MALLITKKCVNCDMCYLECPNQAISMDDKISQIDPTLCTECKGFYSTPNCQSVCPIPNCIIIDPKYIETKRELFKKMKCSS
ncbi:ferrodoxin [Candidatus Photodesmus katoptron]|uniref:Ferredoxin n=1 Tax=Candidatus Photodesmus katoptron Akat1 TaxID=1236703 RepID=S3DJW4_9GAMM|nr:YfhL family 4Fe-4S dicluster ferredoxin [Candidatus Photodesmus katoptron]EPE38010.1 ferredoxin [Candidatus Photodesmus katoptron Akat1]KEY90750.1 ferrodoxin [Candidatus Photodesmus katoptron]